MNIEETCSDTRVGVAALGALVFILAFLLILLGVDIGFIAYSEYCGDTLIADCITGKKSPEPVKPATDIIAKGTLSNGKYGVTITLNIPAEGGAVAGQFNGTCDGKITGTYNTGDGMITGKAFGSCTPFLLPIPARGEFDGTVIPQTRTVPINGSGSAMGISKSGSITLTY